MKIRNYALIFMMGMAIATVSCKKKSSTTVTPTTPTTPTSPAGPSPATPSVGSNISGAMIAIQMKYTSQPTGSPVPIDLNSDMGVAVFYTSPGGATKADAGTVTVNSNSLDKATDNSYSKLAYIGGTPATLGLTSDVSWSVGGNSSVTAFTYDYTAAFPDYTGTVPATVTKSAGVTLTFNSGTLDNADSVVVVVAAGSKSVTRTYKADAGSVTISAADLSSLPVVADNTGIFEVCPYKWVQVTKNGKNYVFIKEQAIVKNVNIN